MKTAEQRKKAEAFAVSKFRELIEGLRDMGYRVEYLTADIVNGCDIDINNEYWGEDADQPIQVYKSKKK